MGENVGWSAGTVGTVGWSQRVPGGLTGRIRVACTSPGSEASPSGNPRSFKTCQYRYPIRASRCDISSTAPRGRVPPSECNKQTFLLLERFCLYFMHASKVQDEQNTRGRGHNAARATAAEASRYRYRQTAGQFYREWEIRFKYRLISYFRLIFFIGHDFGEEKGLKMRPTVSCRGATTERCTCTWRRIVGT